MISTIPLIVQLFLQHIVYVQKVVGITLCVKYAVESYFRIGHVRGSMNKYLLASQVTFLNIAVEQ